MPVIISGSSKHFFNVLRIILLLFIISCEKDEEKPTEVGSTVTFIYNGNEVTYGTIEYAGRFWMDRNLGASQVATLYNDSASFGDYYQWGREVDGHQLKNSNTNNTIAPSQQQPGHANFITSIDYNDWNIDNNWTTRWINNKGQKTSADPCPNGWRVPTKSEWQSAINEENWNNYMDAFNSPLKLPASNYRSAQDGGFPDLYSFGMYWSSDYLASYGLELFLSDENANVNFTWRSQGVCIRCISDN